MTAPGYRFRGIRGATTVERDEAQLICEATQELLTELLRHNPVTPAQIVSALFTVTPDLRSEFPARAARELGWHEVPMLCATEMAVPGALTRCIRVLLHVELPEGHAAIQPVYLRGATALRPDVAPPPSPQSPPAPRLRVTL
ncbi:MAG TPA: chorismate mutase [Gemmatimonadaceae bacterium]|jgi:chorismate mutase|nr:chorismate mutase [Gemmatimonadaceae bacterium]